MSTMQVEVQLPADKLLKAVGQLSQPELEQFVFQVIALRAKRRAPSLSQAEADLLLKVNQGIPYRVQKRYDELVAKRQAETLTPAEYDELLRLTSQIEVVEARRIEYLAELAHLRHTTLIALMENLGIRKPAYA